MASIFESIKLISTDNNFFMKMTIFSLIPFGVWTLVEGKTVSDFSVLDYALVSLLSLIFLGQLFQILNNSIKENVDILPTVDLWRSFCIGVKGALSISLPACGACFLSSFTLTLFDITILPAKIIYIIICVFSMAMVVTSMIFYSENLKILDGVNLKKIFLNFLEATPYIVITAVMLLVLNAILSFPLCYIVYYLFGNGKVLAYVVSYMLTLNLYAIFQSMSHLYFEQFKGTSIKKA